MAFNKIILLLFLSLQSVAAFSQKNSETTFKNLKSEINKDKEKVGTFPFVSWLEFLKFINENKQDTLSVNTNDYISLIGQVGLSSTDKEIRQIVVEIYCRGIYKNAYLNSISINYLRKFKQDDFSDSAKYYLNQGLLASPNNTGSIAKIIAFACGKSNIINLQNALTKQGINKFDKKDIKLAILRADQTTNEQQLLKTAKEQVLNDNFVYNLINDLTYTRNKAVFDYLLELINRDSKGCNSANNDNPEPMICAYRLIEKVAPYIYNFPVKLNANNELDTKDYPALLNEVRAWIKTNKESYTLNQFIY